MTTTKANRATKLLALIHCPSATPAERDTARLRLRELGVPDCKCSLCSPQPKSKPSDAYYARCKLKGFEPSDYFERQAAQAEKRAAHAQARSQYRAARPESLAWAKKIAGEQLAALRTIKKYSCFDQDGARIPMSVVLELYPSAHADRSILVEELNRLPRFYAGEDILIVEGAF